ncbi:MAG: leucine-rich repeat protein [Alloprevotella sp.]|nr:leucine-rich repeat protein [Alloprevotella sp.]
MKHFLLTTLALLCAATAWGQTVYNVGDEFHISGENSPFNEASSSHTYPGYWSTLDLDFRVVSVEDRTVELTRIYDSYVSTETYPVQPSPVTSFTLYTTVTDPKGGTWNVVGIGACKINGRFGVRCEEINLPDDIYIHGYFEIPVNVRSLRINASSITGAYISMPQYSYKLTNEKSSWTEIDYDSQPLTEHIEFTGQAVGGLKMTGYQRNSDDLSTTPLNVLLPSSYKSFAYCIGSRWPQGDFALAESCTEFGGFSDNTMLTSLTIPEYVQTTFTLDNCPNLKALVLKMKQPVEGWWSDKFGISPDAILYVPYGCRDNYRGKAPWSSFKAIYEGTPHAFKSLFLGEQYVAEKDGLKYLVTITQEEDAPNGKQWECRVDAVYGAMPSTYTLPEELELNSQTVGITEWAPRALTERTDWWGDEALTGASGLTEVRLQGHTHTLPDGLFYSSYFRNIRKVYADTPDPQPLPANAFYSDVYYGDLIVGDGRVQKFVQTDGWNRFYHIRGTAQSDGKYWEYWEQGSTSGGRYQWNDSKTGALCGTTPDTPLLETTVTIGGSAGRTDEGDEIRITGVMDEGFKDQTTIERVELGDEIEEIGDRAFEGCTRLEDVVINRQTPPTVGEDAFNDIAPDARLWVPIGTLPAYIADEAFTAAFGERIFGSSSGYMSAMTPLAEGDDAPRVELAYSYNDKYTYNEETGNYEVTGRELRLRDYTVYTYDPETYQYDERRLSDAVTGDVVLPDAINGWPITAIYPDVFAGNTGITSMSLPAELQYIDSRAFMDCTALETIVLPVDVEGIGNQVFDGCTALKDVVNLRPEPINLRNANTFSPETYETATLWVPAGSRDLYADADQSGQWASFLTIKEGDPTGISSPLVTRHSSPIYDLQGRKLRNGKLSNSQMPKGMYIVGGKKVLVK